jgi:hypothetical protein
METQQRKRARAETIKDFGRHRSTAWVGLYEYLQHGSSVGLGRPASQTIKIAKLNGRGRYADEKGRAGLEGGNCGVLGARNLLGQANANFHRSTEEAPSPIPSLFPPPKRSEMLLELARRLALPSWPSGRGLISPGCCDAARPRLAAHVSLAPTGNQQAACSLASQNSRPQWFLHLVSRL